MTRGHAGLLFAAAVLGCGEPTVPSRTAPYGFADPVTGDVFRWPAARLPVRVWSDPRGAMPQLADEGLRVWESLFLYGEFRAVLVGDSLDADVLMRWSGAVPPDVPPDTGPAVFACGGVTRYSVDASNTLDDYVRIEVSTNPGFTDAQVAACVIRVARHEIGHALGIFQHSPDTADLMHGAPRVVAPSRNDRRTVEVLYHTEASIRPRPSGP